MMSDEISPKIISAKAKFRKKRANESFDKKLVDLVRLQMVNQSMAKASGKPAKRPWHADDEQRMRAYRSAKPQS
ncbi:hypothetical protein KF728_19640 [Candidatus Obscuribacterales bacterium]|nr:hypothetical protein [Candidatus Obscuribacterales bacterium]